MKKLFYLLLALPLAFAACEPVVEPTPEPGNDPVLTLTSEATIEFSHEGGDGVIAYTLENAVEGTLLTATCSAQWITDLIAGETVTFVVAANTAEADRETKIVVAYGETSFEVAVKQQGKPNEAPEPVGGVEREAELLIGDYYATEYSEAHNFYFCLTNYGLSEEGYPCAGGFYYFLDLYAVEPVEADGYVTIPAGTYTFELNPSYAEWTIANNEYSLYMAVNETGDDYAGYGGYDSATLVVTADGMTLTAVIEGETHTVTYVGAPELYLGAPIEGAEMVATSLEGYYYGTEYSATYNMGIYLSDLGYDEEGYAVAGGKYYELDIYTDVEPALDAEGYMTIPAGTYKFDAYDSTAAWTIGNEYSAYYAVNAAGTAYDAEAYYDDAVLVVTAEGMTLTAIIDGSEHIVTYEGAPKFYVYETRTSATKVKVEKKAMFVK